MQLSVYIMVTSYILISGCTGFDNKVTINPKINMINNTEICTDFQYPHCIESCIATLTSDTLKLVFHEETPSTYDDLTIFVIHNRVYAKYQTVYMALDPGVTHWYPINIHLTLSTASWTIDNHICGKLQVEFQEIYTDTSGKKTETKIIALSGQFYAYIQ